MNLKHISLVFFATLLLSSPITTNSHFPVTQLVLESLESNSEENYNYIGHGKLDGCLSDDEFWDIYLTLKYKYPTYIGDLESIGTSFEGRHMHGFYFSNEEGTKSSEESKKNIVFFNGLHHSRECMTISMILTILVENLKGILRNDKEIMRFFSNNRIL